ncbi:MAG: diacylglycerol kinase [Caulobacteraceae bacterium]|nr:diacylglycerol kinase [Caulobacter sp.]
MRRSGPAAQAAAAAARPARVGVIRNPQARRHRVGAPPARPAGVRVEEPRSREALAAALRGFASEGLDLLVVDGGDGTVREVLGLAPEAFGGGPPRIAVLPSGTTNVLAADLGARPGWSLAAAMASPRSALRTPLEVRRSDKAEPLRRGFIFGAGVYVEAVRLAERARRSRAVGGAALVGAALAQMGARTALGGREGAWRAGVRMRLRHGKEQAREEARFLLLASTLARMPLGVKPFGPPREGLKVLDVAGAPRRLRWALPLLLSGADRPWLAGAGYRRADPDRLEVTLRTPYVLDGDEFEGGDLVLTPGAPLEFAVP